MGTGEVFTAVDAVPRHPDQLTEAVAYAAIAIGLWAVYRRQRLTVPGRLGGGLLVSVLTARIGAEYFKLPQAACEYGVAFNVGQCSSVPFGIAGLACWGCFPARRCACSASAQRLVIDRGGSPCTAGAATVRRQRTGQRGATARLAGAERHAFFSHPTPAGQRRGRTSR